MVDGDLQGKRRKSNKSSVNDLLFDEVIIEVLCRLPCSKTAVMCKSVCKRWFAIISSPYFVARFIAHKSTRNIAANHPFVDDGVIIYDQIRLKLMKDRTFGLVVRMKLADTWNGLMIRFNDPIYNPRDVTVSRLPPRLVNNLHCTVVGASNDLLLYQNEEDDDDKFRLFISSVQTRQCLSLPSLYVKRRSTYIGLICDPYTCVVVISYTPEGVTELPAYMFSRDTGGRWHDVVLSLPTRTHLLSSCHIFCIGRKLYFCCKGWLFSFDPFDHVNDGVIKCDSVPLPPKLVTCVTFFGVFHEQLYMGDRDDDGKYRVWVLMDEKKGEWSLRHNIMGRDWIPLSGSSSLSELVNRKPCFGKAIGFHPANPNVIYVLSPLGIISCNLSTRNMEIIACQIPKIKTTYPLSDICCSFQITFPVWPTPLPTLQ